MCKASIGAKPSEASRFSGASTSFILAIIVSSDFFAHVADGVRVVIPVRRFRITIYDDFRFVKSIEIGLVLHSPGGSHREVSCWICIFVIHTLAFFHDFHDGVAARDMNDIGELARTEARKLLPSSRQSGNYSINGHKRVCR